MKQLNINSHLTAKERNSLSFPARIVLKNNLLKGDVLDFGCGFGTDMKILKEKGFKVDGYDKHYFSEFPQKKYDTILCFYVLNVLLPEEQTKVLIDLSKLLKPTGRAYIAVRRDVKYEGFRMHKIHKRQTYQCNVVLNSKSIYKNDSCEIYEYQHFNQLKSDNDTNCPFCNPTGKQELILESATAYAIYDKFPVNEGHALIIPKRHCDNYFELSFHEQSGCNFLLNEVKNVVSEIYKPDGYNIGINIGNVAGQSISHVHIHLIPRYKGDVEEPLGGVRGVIPGRQKY
jgi:ATP adenylyltransferase